ncbi:hypothetical protein BKA64DRAFT_674055 [Cadophora sp. MPI-SDFR-AT-0126]|nr:hypothetical protein BKA64DRAFT_674055 [Leotiomycetes sp. MPI-SDFR-AT-0126]
MRGVILVSYLVAASTALVIPSVEFRSAAINPRLDLIGGTTATYTVDTGIDTRDGLESPNLVKDGFGRGAYGVDATPITESSTDSAG